MLSLFGKSGKIHAIKFLFIKLYCLQILFQVSRLLALRIS